MLKGVSIYIGRMVYIIIFSAATAEFPKLSSNPIYQQNKSWVNWNRKMKQEKFVQGQHVVQI